MTRLTWLLFWVLFPIHGWAFNVTFINPGKSDEIFWVTVTRAMEVAARQLGIGLEVIYVEREYPRAFAAAKELAERPKARRPDYVVVVNESGSGPELLRLLDQGGIPVFLAFSGISQPSERAHTGAPRAVYSHWLGSLEPKADEAGYLSAKALIEAGRRAGLYGRDKKLHLVALNGDRSTTTSIKRTQGMLRAVSESSDVVLDQEVFAAFSREKALTQARWLVDRHPHARLVWAANDLMAFGAMQAWEETGKVPGKSVLFSAINTSSEGMSAIREGRLSALAGGHFILGAWSMVMLYDYHHGRDFAKTEGLELETSMFTLFGSEEAARFQARYGTGDFSRIDFRRFSKALNPALRRYDFNFKQLLRE